MIAAELVNGDMPERLGRGRLQIWPLISTRPNALARAGSNVLVALPVRTTTVPLRSSRRFSAP